MAMKSSEYWKKREAENAMKNQISEVQYKKNIEEIYANMMDEINKEINGFYTKYAAKEGITMAEAKKRVSKLDIAAYERKAKKYVETKDFSDRANEEMRIYNLTMKVNRLELLKANIGLEMVSGFDELQKYFDKKLTKRTLDEFRRQAGILGKSIMKNEKYAHAIVNASFKNATYSDRIWMYHGMLKAELEGLLASGLIKGENPRKLARHLTKRFGVSAYNAERLMVTELARVQTEAQKQSFIRNGFDEYVYVACTKGDVSNAKSAQSSLTRMRSSVNVVNAGLDALGSKAKSAINALISQFTNAEGKAKSSGNAVGNNFNSGVSSGMSRAVSTARSMSASTVSAMRSAGSGSYSCGVYIGAGLANGMASQVGRVRSVAAQLAAAAEAAIRAKAQIHSPSKVTDKLGGYFGEGWVNGISDRVTDAKKAAWKLVDIPDLVPVPEIGAGLRIGIEDLNDDYDYTRNETYTIYVPVEVDGRQVAKATAKYTKEEIEQQQKRDLRKKGMR